MGQVAELATNTKPVIVGLKQKGPNYNGRKVYYLLNKPRGVISSVSMIKGRTTVVPFISSAERIHSVGRVWTGIHLVPDLTNDGDFTDEMIHPRNEIDKVYVACVCQKD